MKKNREDIMQIIPHRPPMLLLDEVELLDDGCSIGWYYVQGDEFFLQGHFPGNPVVPGVILCEMMAQSACLLADNSDGVSYTPYFTGMDKIRFKKKVMPGDLLKLTSKLIRSKGMFYFVKCTVYVNNSLCCAGEISFALVKED